MGDSVYTDYYNQFVQDAQLDATIDANSITDFIAWLDANAATEDSNTTTALDTSFENTNMNDFNPTSISPSDMIS